MKLHKVELTMIMRLADARSGDYGMLQGGNEHLMNIRRQPAIDDVIAKRSQV